MQINFDRLFPTHLQLTDATDGNRRRTSGLEVVTYYQKVYAPASFALRPLTRRVPGSGRDWNLICCPSIAPRLATLLVSKLSTKKAPIGEMSIPPTVFNENGYHQERQDKSSLYAGGFRYTIWSFDSIAMAHKDIQRRITCDKWKFDLHCITWWDNATEQVQVNVRGSEYWLKQANTLRLRKPAK